MNILEILVFLGVAGFAGALGQAIAGSTRKGCLVSIALGLIGALLGSWIAGVLGLPHLLDLRIGGEPFPLIWSVFGASLFVAVIGAIARQRRRAPASQA